MLRSLVYQRGHGESSLALEGGKTRLAKMLGVAARSVRRWFSALAKSPLRHFVQEGEKASQEWELTLRMGDPIHPSDWEKFHKELEKLNGPDKNGQQSGQKWTGKSEAPYHKMDRTGQEGGQRWTEQRTKVNKDPDKT